MKNIEKDFAEAGALTTAEIGRRFFGDRPSDACGVGAVVSLTGKPQHQVFRRGLLTLANMEHRGAESADGVSGDGAGVLFNIPKNFFGDYLSNQLNVENVASEQIGIGQFFMPKETQHPSSAIRAVQIVEDTLQHYGITNFAWRTPKVNSASLGPIAASTEPDMRQAVFECPSSDAAGNDKLLHKVRLEIEKRIAAEKNATLDQSFYACSLSSSTIVYKAMVKPSQLADYHADLKMFLDAGTETSVMLVHQRFATNAAPHWKLAHPYRFIAHNGEINTIPSTARDAEARTAWYKEPGHKAIQTTGSDTAQLDTIIDMLVSNGWSPVQALRHLIPPALHPSQSQETQNYINVTQALSTQGDGPAGIVCTDGLQFCAGTDRNSLRPMNVVLVGRDVLIVSSEAGSGILPHDKTSRLLLSGGQAVTVNLATGEYRKPLQVEQDLASSGPYAQWAQNLDSFTPARIISADRVAELKADRSDRLPPALLAQMKAVGLTEEDRKDVTATLAETGKEVVSSMGNTKPPAVFSNLASIHARFSNFFVQNFAQVTNPPIDSLREGSSFDMKTRLGDRGDLISAHPDRLKVNPFSLIELESPVLTSEEFSDLKMKMTAKGWKSHAVDATFTPSDWRGIEKRVDGLIAGALKAVEGGATQLIISHRAVSQDAAHIPSLLMVAGIDKALKERSLRHKVNIHSEAADIHDTHSLSSNITAGADTVVPFLTEKLLAWSYRPTESDAGRTEKALKTYKKGMHSGLMKIMAKMGVTTLNSYRGGHVHTALGVDRALVEKYFGNADTLVSPISGMTMTQLSYSIARNHVTSYAEQPRATMLHLIGRRSEADGEIDLHTPITLRLLGEAIDPNTSSTQKFQAYTAEANRIRTENVVLPDGREIDRRAPILLRDLWALKEADVPLTLAEVQSPSDIVKKHLAIAAMSYGALSKEAIGAMNRVAADLGMEVNSGEGGQDPRAAFGATTMQVASGRFGVTIEYLNSPNASGNPRVQIKVAQGAKPGEGGQLPGAKVTEDIARVRHATPGVDLISPPPHHDIYSIEDLAQLIRDLKATNPALKVSVKLVSGVGVGEIAAGVVKCGADEVHISGNDGGTGAASLTSIQHAGLPAEIGVANTQQNLVEKGMREPIHREGGLDQSSISSDGSIRTGRDIVILAILGADKLSVGTAVAQMMGCIMVRQCHSNTCPVDIATQDPAYRSHFRTDAEQRLRNGIMLLAQDVQFELSQLGLPSLESARGRTDLLLDRRLLSPEAYSEQVRSLDLNPLVHVAAPPANIDEIRVSRAATTTKLDFNARLLADAGESLKSTAATGVFSPLVIERDVSNTDLSVGTGLGGVLVRARTAGGTPPDVDLNLRGYGGQSLGAFLAKGVRINLEGEANDYVGKGLSGGEIVIRAPANQSREGGPSAVKVGNAVLFGATSGEFFCDGSAGGRFAVRNSGANAVIKGGGDYFGEYMTGGMIVSLGPVGKGSFAGMTGGFAAIYDPKSGAGAEGGSMSNNPKTGLPFNFDTEGKQVVRLDGAHGALQLDEGYAEATRNLIQKFADKTRDRTALRILDNWDQQSGNFWAVIPDQYAIARRKVTEQAPRATAVVNG